MADGTDDSPYNPFDGVAVDAGVVVLQEPVANALGDDDGHERRITADDLKRVYDGERLNRHITKALSYIGRKKGLTSIQIDETNEEFRAAVEVVHKRLADGVAGPLLDKMAGEAIEDLVIVTIGFGSVFVDLFKEVKEKRAGVRQSQQEPEPQPQSEPETNSEASDDGE